MASLVNRGLIPDYCREARICPLSKTGNPCVTVEDIRPISIQGQPRKIIEQMIKQMLDNSNSKLLESQDY